MKLPTATLGELTIVGKSGANVGVPVTPSMLNCNVISHYLTAPVAVVVGTRVITTVLLGPESVADSACIVGVAASALWPANADTRLIKASLVPVQPTNCFPTK